MNDPPRVLVIDDDTFVRRTWEEILADLGYSATTVATAEEAIARTQTEPFEVALVDLFLRGEGGGPGGIEVVRRLLNLVPDCLIIVVTAYPSDETIADAFEAGASDYVLKNQFFKTLLTHKMAAVAERIRARRLNATPQAARDVQVSELYESCLVEKDPNRKGALLESLMVALLSSIAGFIPSLRRRNEHEEIDVWVRNESPDPFWQKERAFLLVECKNWSAPTPAMVIRDVREKVRYKNDRCRAGFLVAPWGFTEPTAKVLLESRGEDILVVPIDGEGLRRLVQSGDRSEALKQLYDAAVRAGNGH